MFYSINRGNNENLVSGRKQTVIVEIREEEPPSSVEHGIGIAASLHVMNRHDVIHEETK